MVVLLAPALWLSISASATPTDAGVVDAEPTTVVVAARDPVGLPAGRATSTVSRAELEQRLPRSAPDALRFEPGVFVQQTAHGQGSAYLRGLTGQRTVLLFDGARLNTGTWRQGPNQYFFTLDARVLDSIDVVRGGASTWYGSDAMGGAVVARPREPSGLPGVRGAVLLRGASADSEYGGRGELDAAVGPVSLLAGVGARHVGLLRAGGALAGSEVPRFGADGQTQLGTGFDEVTADVRAVVRPATDHRVSLAAYGYFQLEAPRTDLCPPARARFDECLTYELQQRSLVTATWSAGESVRAVAWWQRQHERRRAERPASFFVERGEDIVDSFGASATGVGRLGPVRLTAGGDAALDAVRSNGTVGFTDLGVSLPKSRGLYLDGARQLLAGAFLAASVSVSRVTVRGGGRAALAWATAPADPASGSSGVGRAWVAPAGFVGVELRLADRLSLLAAVDHSFRAPNLDDLTSRQQTGPGFQFENAALAPERSTSAELGARLRTRQLELEAFAFGALLTDAIARAPREVSDCPPSTPQCATSQARFQLVNLPAPAMILGAELSGRARPVDALTLQGTVSYAWGEGPHPSGSNARVPLSRVPPLNGALEAWWSFEFGLKAGAALRWALPQMRLAIEDLSDSRIPAGGTPGFAVVDLRASWRLGDRAVGAVVLENLFGSTYRYHGSSVNGPARGVIATVELGL